MPEYIERDTLIAKILVIRPSGVFTEAFKHLVLKIISEQPIADVQEVVRCKDCSYFCKATVNKKGFLICPASGMDITNNDFCSYGAKMDKE